MLHTLVQGTMLQQLFHRISMLLMIFIGFLGDSCSWFLHVRQKLLLSTHKLKLSQDVIIHVTKNIFLKFLKLKWPCLEQCSCRSFLWIFESGRNSMMVIDKNLIQFNQIFREQNHIPFKFVTYKHHMVNPFFLAIHSASYKKYC